MATSQELVVRDSSSEAAVMELEKILRSGEAPKLDVVTDPKEIQRQIAARILDSENVDDVFAGLGEAIGWQELLGVPVEVHGFRYMPTQFDEAEGGAPVFMVVDGVRLDDGSKVVLTNGGYNVMAQLTKLAQLGALPAIVKLELSEEKTKNNFRPLWLTKATQAEEDLARKMADPSNPLDED